MDLENQLFDSAMTWGADYFGVADLPPARDTVLEQDDIVLDTQVL